jgi:hypothetical protein
MNDIIGFIYKLNCCYHLNKLLLRQFYLIDCSVMYFFRISLFLATLVQKDEQLAQITQQRDQLQDTISMRQYSHLFIYLQATWIIQKNANRFLRF